MLANYKDWNHKMAENRIPREIATRQQEMRPTAWKPPELLPEPDKIPGWSYRWIRVAALDKPDPRNLSAKLREGWEPEKIENQPKFQLLTDPTSRFKDNIEIGGLLLCKTPDEFVAQRNSYYRKVANDQITSVDNQLMRQSNPKMPLFKNSSSEVSRSGF